MSGLWRNQEGTREGKYLVKRRDGTIPKWPWFVLSASDPAAPTALWAYATDAEALGMDPEYVSDVRALAAEFVKWRLANGNGDPDAPRHRIDDPAIIEEMRQGDSA